MPVFESVERQLQAEDDLAHVWTKFRAGDSCIISAKWSDIDGKEVTIKFPYYFLIDNEQAYIVNESVFPFKESELTFVEQEIYGLGIESPLKKKMR